jgi:hypothetical protein
MRSLVRSSCYAAGMALLAAVPASADFAPISGQLSASAGVTSPTFGNQNSNPAPVNYGSAFGTFTHGATAQTGPTASVTMQSVRTPTSLSFTVDGSAQVGGFVNATASFGANFNESFTLTSPSVIQVDLAQTSNQLISFIIADAPPPAGLFADTVPANGSATFFHTLAAGTYFIRSAGGYAQASSIPSSPSPSYTEHLTAVYTIVPEPSAAALMSLAGIAGIARRRRRSR